MGIGKAWDGLGIGKAWDGLGRGRPRLMGLRFGFRWGISAGIGF